MRYTYKVGGKEIVLERDDDHVAVRYAEPAKTDTRMRVAEESGLGEFADRVEIPREKFTLFTIRKTAKPAAERLESAEKSLNESDDVARIAPVFKVGNARVVATDRLIVALKAGTDPESVFTPNDCTVIERDGDEYIVAIPESSDPFKVVAKLDGRDDVEYAEPDFVTVGKHLPRTSDASATPEPLDPLAPDQYAIQITKAVDAWGLKTGDPAIKIAILDEGVDTNHEDLASVLVGTFDGVDADTDQTPNAWDGHGTACAGLAAAIHNDKGIKGLGGGCSIMAARIAYSPSKGANWVTRNSWIGRAIDWCWQNGADVLSNSWGGGLPSNRIVTAFVNARTQGRGGKGCVIIAAAGNDAGPVSFPATESEILSVSATNEFDEFKTKTSRDGETWWGSNFGPEVDVGAPGVHNQTTDISGAAGYTNTNYTDFNGTSSATPIVAGIAGLVLSAKPELTESEVRDILRNSADKVGAEPYDANGRNDQFGFGRVNALEALKLAGVEIPVPPPSTWSVLHKVTHGVAIQDHQTSTVEVVAGEDREIKDVKVHVALRHTWIGDLKTRLLPPADSNLAAVDLHVTTGGDADDIIKTYDPSTTPDLAKLIGKKIPGKWTLEVKDTQTQDEGEIESFGIELSY